MVKGKTDACGYGGLFADSWYLGLDPLKEMITTTF
jgi:hypothetical protein